MNDEQTLEPLAERVRGCCHDWSEVVVIVDITTPPEKERGIVVTKQVRRRVCERCGAEERGRRGRAGRMRC